MRSTERAANGTADEQLRHFQRLLRLGEPPVISVEDGARTLAATLAIAQAAAREQPVYPLALLAA